MSLATALIELGPQAQSLGPLRLLLCGFCRGHVGVAQACEVMRRVGVHARHIVQPTVDEIHSFNPHVLIAYSTRPPALATLARNIRAINCRRALWFCDLRPPNVASLIRGSFDGIFLPWTGRFHNPSLQLGDCHVEAWNKLCHARCWYMPQAAELREVTPSPTHAHSVVFVGDLALPCHRGRQKLCRAVGAKVINAREGRARAEIYRASPMLYASSGFCLSTSPLADGYTSNRTYNITGCGGLLLLQRFPDADRLFTHGEHALMFDTSSEATALIERFRGDEQERSRLKFAGWKLASRKHTWAHRLLNIASNVMGTDSTFWGFS
jgi:Glycosyl transferases group 1